MRLESDGTVALVVSGVLARRHAGVYTCTVTNEMGQVSSNARVTIRQRPLAIPSSSLDAISSDHDNIGYVIIAHVLVSSRFFSFFLSFWIFRAIIAIRQSITHIAVGLFVYPLASLSWIIIIIFFWLSGFMDGEREGGGGSLTRKAGGLWAPSCGPSRHRHSLYRSSNNRAPVGFWFIFTLFCFLFLLGSAAVTNSRSLFHHARTSFFFLLLWLVVCTTIERNNNSKRHQYIHLSRWMTLISVPLFKNGRGVGRWLWFKWKKKKKKREPLVNTIHGWREIQINIEFFFFFFLSCLTNRMLCHLYYVTAAMEMLVTPLGVFSFYWIGL